MRSAISEVPSDFNLDISNAASLKKTGVDTLLVTGASSNEMVLDGERRIRIQSAKIRAWYGAFQLTYLRSSDSKKFHNEELNSSA